MKLFNSFSIYILTFIQSHEPRDPGVALHHLLVPAHRRPGEERHPPHLRHQGQLGYGDSTFSTHTHTTWIGQETVKCNKYFIRGHEIINCHSKIREGYRSHGTFYVLKLLSRNHHSILGKEKGACMLKGYRKKVDIVSTYIFVSLVRFMLLHLKAVSAPTK